MTMAQIGREVNGLAIDGLCLTDHQVMAGPDLLSVMPRYYPSFVGMEYATSQGDFLLFGLEKPPIDGMAAMDILLLVDDLDGASVSAHPCRAGRSLDPSLLKSGLIHAVEVLNGRCTPEENIAAFELARAHNLPRTGGSDAHTIPELGRFATIVDYNVGNIAELALAIRRGDVSPVALDQDHTTNALAARA